jgi:transcriptional regulator with XRE-family HTH domain
MASQAGHPIRATVGRNIKAAREERGLTQSALARLLGVESMAVSRWERGRVRPTDANLHALARALRRDPAWFYAEHDGAAA